MATKKRVGQDDNFAGSVDASHVICGIRFRYAHILGFAQDLIVIERLLCHSSEYVIARAIEYPPYIQNPSACEGVAYKVDNWHCAADGRLVPQRDPIRMSKLRELIKGGHQRPFVRGNNVSLVFKRFTHVCQPWFTALDICRSYLHHDVVVYSAYHVERRQIRVRNGLTASFARKDVI